ncbi:MAG: VOC family protein [Actinomycetes bacterium]
MTSPPPLRPTRVRLARPVRDLQRSARFYLDVVGLEQLTSFAGHDGFDGVILAAGPALEIELVHGPSGLPVPTPTHEDLIVLWLTVEPFLAVQRRLAAAGHPPFAHPNPFWARNGAVAYTDPEGYVLVLAPS